MRLLLQPIAVEADAGGRPRRLHWRGRLRPVRAWLERWWWRGRWWQDAALVGEERLYWRVLCGRGVFELFRRRRPQQPDDWVLSRLLD